MMKSCTIEGTGLITWLYATNWVLLPGAPAFTRAGLALAGLIQFSGRNIGQP